MIINHEMQKLGLCYRVLVQHQLQLGIQLYTTSNQKLVTEYASHQNPGRLSSRILQVTKTKATRSSSTLTLLSSSRPILPRPFFFYSGHRFSNPDFNPECTMMSSKTQQKNQAFNHGPKESNKDEYFSVRIKID